MLLSFAAITGGLLPGSTILNFEQFSDSQILTTQIAGVSFTNTQVLTAGISLNEIDFPPHSGANVVIDNGGAITISFSNPIASFGAYFTYTEPLTISGFNTANQILALASSPFSNNTGTGGDAGSSPNEVLQIMSAAGISSVVIAGDPLGGSFAMDDLTFTDQSTTTPEPTPVNLNLIGIVCILVAASKYKASHKA